MKHDGVAFLQKAVADSDFLSFPHAPFLSEDPVQDPRGNVVTLLPLLCSVTVSPAPLVSDDRDTCEDDCPGIWEELPPRGSVL